MDSCAGVCSRWKKSKRGGGRHRREITKKVKCYNILHMGNKKDRGRSELLAGWLVGSQMKLGFQQGGWLACEVSLGRADLVSRLAYELRTEDARGGFSLGEQPPGGENEGVTPMPAGAAAASLVELVPSGEH